MNCWPLKFADRAAGPGFNRQMTQRENVKEMWQNGKEKRRNETKQNKRNAVRKINGEAVAVAVDVAAATKASGSSLGATD